MNEMFQERRGLFLTLASLILVLLIVLYFAFIQPLAADRKAKEAEAGNTQKEIEALQAKEKRLASEPTKEEALVYKQNMPQVADLDQLIKSLDEIAEVSTSRIEKIEFAYDEDLPEREEPVSENEAEDGQTAEDKTADPSSDKPEAESSADAKTTPAQEDTAAQELKLEKKPKNLHTISMRIDVSSPDYAHFDQLIKEIEKLERVTLVNTLEFENPAEADLIMNDNPDQSIDCTVELMTFYYDEK